MDSSKFDKYYNSLSPDEKAYFIACTDIFHDTPYNVVGRPSSARQLQNCVVLNLEKNISQADFANVTPGAIWDCNVVSFPWITDLLFGSAIDYGSSIDANTTHNPKSMGGITCFAADGGNPTFGIDTNPTVRLTATELLYPQGDGQNSLRKFYEILAMGYEIYNTTPDLYVGGSLIRYRVPGQNRESGIQITASGRTLVLPVRCSPPIPSTESLATQYPDSVIDEAKKGSYQQHTIQDNVSDFRAAANLGELITASTVEPVAPPTDNCYVSQPLFVLSTNSPAFHGDFDTCGTYFAGLPPQTTLKIRLRYIVSIVPSSTDASLVSLAKVSPPENVRLVQLISQIQNSFPPGVPVNMNPKGEWWKKVVKVLGAAAPAIGEAFAGKTGRDVGQMVQGITNTVASERTTRKPKASNPKGRPKAGPKGTAKSG